VKCNYCKVNQVELLRHLGGNCYEGRCPKCGIMDVVLLFESSLSQKPSMPPLLDILQDMPDVNGSITEIVSRMQLNVPNKTSVVEAD